jgi:hypothetical protein
VGQRERCCWGWPAGNHSREGCNVRCFHLIACLVSYMGVFPHLAQLYMLEAHTATPLSLPLDAQPSCPLISDSATTPSRQWPTHLEQVLHQVNAECASSACHAAHVDRLDVRAHLEGVHQHRLQRRHCMEKSTHKYSVIGCYTEHGPFGEPTKGPFGKATPKRNRVGVVHAWQV